MSASATQGGHNKVAHDMTYKWNVVHGVDDHALVLQSVLRDASQTGLHYVIAVQELLFC